MSAPLIPTAPGRGFHYAWVIGALTFLVLLAAAGVRAAPGVLIVPLETDFGWDRASISLAVAVSIVTFGLGAPLAGGLVDRFGPRRVMLGGLLLIVLGLAPLVALRDLWQLHLFWGLVTGVGTGAVSNVLGATIALRWFRAHRGIVLGAFAAAASAGQLIFIPTLATVTVDYGWRTAIGVMTVALAAIVLPVLVLMRDRPADVGARAYGDTDDATAAHD
jgi:sugar phosphate permease